ncbi:glycosyltransferase [Chitinophagaceae bacterium MMS25-I14]
MEQTKDTSFKATVIISVYNRIDFLKLVLAGFEMQTERNFEIIVSDDGSGPAFVNELKDIIAASPLKIRHNWHADDGFRKNQILNSSIMLAASDYLVFVDGDCIPHPRFMEEHLAHAQPGVCLVGRRVNISKKITEMLTDRKILAGILTSPQMMFSMIAGNITKKVTHLKMGLYFRNSFLRRFFNRKDKGILGSNFSIYKKDMLDINGFDERYVKPTYGEDSDIDFRLRLNGVRIQSLINIVVQYHCHHKLLPRPVESKIIYEQVLKEKKAFTDYGIIKK